MFRKAEDLDRVILPISFDETREALAQNLETRKDGVALSETAWRGDWHLSRRDGLDRGQTVFGPAGPDLAVSFTAQDDREKQGAQVVPIYFDGHNSRLFQLASHLHATLRVALLIKEFRARVDEPVRIAIGEPIAQADLDKRAGDPKAMMDFLRKATYELSPSTVEFL